MNAKSYLIGYRKQVLYYRDLANLAIDQLSDEQLLFLPNKESNSIAIIMKHVAGNIFSRWTDMFNSDGEKEWRNRDAEFVLDDEIRIEDLKGIWGKAWLLVDEEISKLLPSDLEKVIYIRNEGHILPDALNRQLAHMSYHIGQMLYIGKMLKGDSWSSLSIPKGESDNYNQRLKSQVRSVKHYTDKIFKNQEE